jgi:hypothetical protein
MEGLRAGSEILMYEQVKENGSVRLILADGIGECGCVDIAVLLAV